MAEGGLGSFDESLPNVRNAEGSLMRRDDVIIDDGCQMQVHVVFGHADLLWNLYKDS